MELRVADFMEFLSPSTFLTWSLGHGTRNSAYSGSRRRGLRPRKDEPTYLMACSQPLQDLATIMLETGMRPAEVTDLRKTDLNFAKGSIQISKGKTKAAR